jgi:hypothetical protein
MYLRTWVAKNIQEMAENVRFSADESDIGHWVHWREMVAKPVFSFDQAVLASNVAECGKMWHFL